MGSQSSLTCFLMAHARAAPVATPERPPDEDLNTFFIFPNPEENLKVLKCWLEHTTCVVVGIEEPEPVTVRNHMDNSDM